MPTPSIKAPKDRPAACSLLLATLLACRILCGTTQAADKPNILLIMVDDLGKDWIGCYGADGIETPNIDGLAKSGLTFHHAYSMPQCTPTRVTLLTGQYPWRTGWVNHWDVPRWGVGYFDWRQYRTFATLMKSGGYRTAAAGKWQINDFRLEPDAPAKHGFDAWCLWTGYETGNPPSAERYWDPYIHTNGGSKTYRGQFGPDVYADFLIDFIGKNRDRPMMLYWPMALTHSPLVHTPNEMQVSGKWECHRAMVRYADALVGRVVAAIDDAGIRHRTIIFFTTDNGSGGGVRGTIKGSRPSGGKASNYEGGVCAPFIVNCPGLVHAGEDTNALTDFSDLLPTFAELADVDIPEPRDIDGISIAPVVLGKAKRSPRQWILAMGHGPAVLDESGIRGRVEFMDRVLRDERYKVWVGTDRKIERLYDLATDPWEWHDLIDSQADEHVAARRKFAAVVDAMPGVDGRPRYTPRAKNAWDKKAPD